MSQQIKQRGTDRRDRSDRRVATDRRDNQRKGGFDRRVANRRDRERRGGK